jgi:hypothetical protein
MEAICFLKEASGAAPLLFLKSSPLECNISVRFLIFSWEHVEEGFLHVKLLKATWMGQYLYLARLA